MPEELTWPQERIPLESMRAWLSSRLPGRPEVRTHVRPLRVKRWGATGAFTLASGETVIAKHAEPPLFPAGVALHQFVKSAAPHAVAPLLAVEDGPGWQRSAYGFVAGPTLASHGAAYAPEATRALAAIQIACADAISTALPELPRNHLPEVGDQLFEDVRRAGDQDPQLTARLDSARGEFRSLARELASTVPASIDHTDMNADNIIIPQGGPIVVLDWEEARIGCPLMSLYWLLTDADGNEDDIIDAYADAVGPLGATADLVRAATVLAPIKLAMEGRQFARALGWKPPFDNHPNYTRRLLTTALERLEVLQGRARGLTR